MPPTATPPNPAPPTREKSAAEVRETMRAGRYGEMEQHELLQLLDTFDDERSKSRFRESIYISLLVYLVLGWFLIYGPRVLFHQGRIVSPADVLKQREKELTYLDMPKDISKLKPPKTAKAISDHASVAQTSKPSLDKKTLDQLRAQQRAGEQAPAAAAPAPTPAPAPQPQQAQQQPQQPPPPTPLPQVQQRVTPQQTTAVPDAPKPNFTQPQTAGRAMQDVTRGAVAPGALGAEGSGTGTRSGHQGANTGLEVLSDTLGVDFGPYIRRLLLLVKASWYPLIPEETRPPLNKEGTTLIRFRIEQDGHVSYMHLDDSTHDQAIDRAAWGGITGVGQFPPLPAAFKGPNLDLRIQFIISHHYASDQ